jgi:hypothetical protein
MDSSAPSILRLPVEILTDILSPVVHSVVPEEIYYYNGRAVPLNKSPFHAVRSTCRTFRWIVDELPFWRDDELNFRRIDDRYRPRRSQSGHYVDVLLSDPHLCQCLHRKTGWDADNVSIFRVLVRHISHFGQCVRYLRLSIFDKAFTDSFQQTLLDTFPILTFLELTSQYHVHFDCFPPSLRKLVLVAPLKCDRNCTNGLPNLEQLVLRQSSVTSLLNFNRVLPFNSKETLQELEFRVAYQRGKQTVFDFTILHQFGNLTTLRMPEVAPLEMYQSLLESPFR